MSRGHFTLRWQTCCYDRFRGLGNLLVRHDDADGAIRYFEQLITLLQSLRQIDVAIYRHHWRCLRAGNCLRAGSWSLVAGTRHRSFLFSWDGRAGFLSIQGPFHAVEGGSRKFILYPERAQWLWTHG